MSLYPSLEDMNVSQLSSAQHQQNHEHTITGAPPLQDPDQSVSASALYPSLNEYMGLQITPSMMQDMQVRDRHATEGQTMVAPITDNNLGLARAEIKQGIRQVVCCKDDNGKVGLRLHHVNTGVFVEFVQAGSPAALAGLRFGDQILQINGQNMAGYDTAKAYKLLKQIDGQRIELSVRDRPFERSMTIQKDSSGYIGFIFKDGRIESVVKDSSAACLPIDHQLIEIEGQNVVGLKDKEIHEIINNSDRTITVAVLPCFIYDHIVKCMMSSMIKKKMDHSIPDV